MTSYTNHEKRIWEDTPAGKLDAKIRKLHNKFIDKKKFTEDMVRWVDIHRASTMSKERDLILEFEKESEELKKKYEQKHQDFMIDTYTKELDYLKQYE